MKTLKTVFLIISILLVPSFGVACDKPETPHKRAFAQYLDDDSIAIFFVKDIDGTSLSSVLITYIEDGEDKVSMYAELYDHAFGIDGIDMNNYKGVVIYIDKSNAGSLIVASSYYHPAIESDALWSCKGISYTDNLVDLL